MSADEADRKAHDPGYWRAAARVFRKDAGAARDDDEARRLFRLAERFEDLARRLESA